MQKYFSFIPLQINITNEYSDYQFQFYLGNLPDQTLGYHQKCYSSYTHKKDLRFQTNFQNKRKLEGANFQSSPRKGSRVLDAISN